MILLFAQIGTADLAKVGGKGANLGALARAGFPVPPGFCVTTDGFRAFTAGCPELPELYGELDALGHDDVAGARRLGTAVRAALLKVPLPPELAAEAVSTWQSIGAQYAYAVRSSATAEDLPGASFAGQQDTYLNIHGEPALLDAIRRCFASLFTDRAILYRAQNGFGHRDVALCVVVQRMVLSESAGILFTADPVSGHRGTLTIEAGFGLGEALVSGLITADLYRVDKPTGMIKEVRIGDKSVAIRPQPGGGTRTEHLSAEQRKARVLDDAAIQELLQLGRKVESYYAGQPQDIEWCWEGGKLFLVQARPITSLYPLPEPQPTDGVLHVYFSFSHVQNMTAPMSPLGMDLWRGLLPFGKARLDEVPAAGAPTVLVEAGGRLYGDVTSALVVGPLRKLILVALGAIYPELGALVKLLAERKEVQSSPPPQRSSLRLFRQLVTPIPKYVLRELWSGRPENLTGWANTMIERQVSAYRAQVAAAPPGVERLRAARAAIGELFRVVPELAPGMMVGMIFLSRLRRRFAGTPHAADVEALQRGLVGNVTMEMDLQVADLANLARPYPALVEALRRGGIKDAADLEALRPLPGGPAFLFALTEFLQRFGMRGSGEIDVARPRWADAPGLLLGSIAGSLTRAEVGVHREHFQKLQDAGVAAGQRLVAAAGGGLVGRWVDRQVRYVRYGLGLREHPKYMIVQCFAVLRAAVLEAAQALKTAGRIDAAPDVFFLHYDELLTAVAAPAGVAAADLRSLIATRKAEQERARHLTPPLVMTSEGEVPRLPLPKDLPAGALAGLGASAGVVEGVARVVLDPGTEILQAGEILVAPFTDPGWTPLFVHAAGLVCDVGGMMTHGSVVAREYGIPAVVGVGDGTKRIRNGQRLRVDGSRGVVEILPT